MNKLLTSVLAISAACVTALSYAQEVKGSALAGADKNAMCLGCHGIPNYRTTFPQTHRVPKISGQGEKYIASALKAYRKGERKHPSMHGVAGNLTDQDIADLAAYYSASGSAASSAPPPLAREADLPTAALLQRGGCVACHGANFAKPIDPTYPKIAGQHSDYLLAALKAYKIDNHNLLGRANPIMGGVAKQFSDSELKLLAAYLGSLPGDLETVTRSRFH